MEQKLPARHAYALLYLQGFALSYEKKLNLITNSEMLTISFSEIDNYRMSPDLLYFYNSNMIDTRSPPPPIAIVNTVPDLALFKNSIKSDPSQFKQFNDACKWNNWHLHTVDTARGPDLQDVSNPNYVHYNFSDVTVFEAMQF